MPWTVHRHRQLWDRPDAFMPENAFTSGNREKLDRYQYLPLRRRPAHLHRRAIRHAGGVIALAVLMFALPVRKACRRPTRWPVQKLNGCSRKAACRMRGGAAIAHPVDSCETGAIFCFNLRLQGWKWPRSQRLRTLRKRP